MNKILEYMEKNTNLFIENFKTVNYKAEVAKAKKQGALAADSTVEEAKRYYLTQTNEGYKAMRHYIKEFKAKVPSRLLADTTEAIEGIILWLCLEDNGWRWYLIKREGLAIWWSIRQKLSDFQKSKVKKILEVDSCKDLSKAPNYESRLKACKRAAQVVIVATNLFMTSKRVKSIMYNGNKVGDVEVAIILPEEVKVYSDSLSFYNDCKAEALKFFGLLNETIDDDELYGRLETILEFTPEQDYFETKFGVKNFNELFVSHDYNVASFETCINSHLSNYQASVPEFYVQDCPEVPVGVIKYQDWNRKVAANKYNKGYVDGRGSKQVVDYSINLLEKLEKLHSLAFYDYAGIEPMYDVVKELNKDFDENDSIGKFYVVE